MSLGWEESDVTPASARPAPDSAPPARGEHSVGVSGGNKILQTVRGNTDFEAETARQGAQL